MIERIRGDKQGFVGRGRGAEAARGSDRGTLKGTNSATPEKNPQLRDLDIFLSSVDINEVSIKLRKTIYSNS